MFDVADRSGNVSGHFRREIDELRWRIASVDDRLQRRQHVFYRLIPVSFPLRVPLASVLLIDCVKTSALLISHGRARVSMQRTWSGSSLLVDVANKRIKMINMICVVMINMICTSQLC